jgi:primosomal protein N' (replication factor Y)
MLCSYASQMKAQTASNAPFHAQGARVRVLIPLPLAGPYDYLAPVGMALTRGDHVIVPLGPREVAGVVWQTGHAEGGSVPDGRLKPVSERREARPLPERLCDFIDWVANYTLSPPGAVLALALRARGALDPPPTRTAWRLTAHRPDRMTPARVRVIEKAGDGLARGAQELAREAGVSPGVIRGLADQGVLEAIIIEEDAPFPAPGPDAAMPSLSREQAAAAEVLEEAVRAHAFSPLLLDGVTGAGKTETYFAAVAEALRQNRQVLILLPEIALTVPFIDRFAARFGVAPAEWHSDISQAERRRVWRHVASGQARVVAGARSALFLPFRDLGLIVVDEEHDQAFKQEEGVIYHARDMAVVRARIEECPIVLSSATPSLESVVNARIGRYRRLHLPARHGAAELPRIEAIDLRAAPPERGAWLAPPLVAAVGQTLARGEQVLLFLNRRGYAPVTVCRKCGHHLRSPESSALLVEHRYLGRLVDHHTGFSMPKPKQCPACEAEDSLVACGPGVERLAEEARGRWPDARQAVMSSDLAGSPRKAEVLLGAMAARGIDILIGTQMVAKGHHFPHLTLVGVVDADLGLRGGDLRAGERTYQLLHQVAGRAGRAAHPGHVLLQTYQPEHRVIEALVSGDRDRFLAEEAAEREAAGMPPFGRLAAVILSGRDGAVVENTAQALARSAPGARDVELWGPAPAPFAVLRGRHRFRFLVKAAREVNMQAWLRHWLGMVKVPNAVRVTVDIDPYSFL